MRNIIYLIAVGITWMFSACQDITVGFLDADTARYTVDTLHITNVTSELRRLKGIETNFYEKTQSLQEEVEQLVNDTRELEGQWGEEEEELLTPIWDAMDEALDNDDWDRYDELFDQQMQVETDLENKYQPQIDAIEAEIDEKNEDLENLATEMGIGSFAILQKQIADYQQKVDFKLPWTTSEIEGVDGTQPLLFSVIDVKNDDAEAAAKFMTYTGVLGAGTIYVEYDVDVPPGNYTVTLQIENEGRTKILQNIFTFVVDAEIPNVVQGTPGVE